MKKKKIKPIIISLLCIALVLTACFVVLRFRGSTVIKSTHREDISLNAALLRQDDKLWAEDTLGTSSYTMKKSGCLTTCIASALNTSPADLNRLFSDNKVYDSNGNIQWDKIRQLGYSVEVYTAVSEEDIYYHLKEGHYPIVRVRVNGMGNFHYVLITGVENDDYICMDPLKNEYTKLSSYLNRVYALRIVY